MRAQLLKVVVPIKMSAMIAGNEVDIASKDMLTQFAWIVSVYITILQHVVLKQIMQQLWMHDFRIDKSIHRFLLQCIRITFLVVRVIAAFYCMNDVWCKNYSCLL